MKEKSPKKHRALNVIYFIDSNRTRSLKIPLNRLAFVVASSMAIVVWASTSTFLNLTAWDYIQEQHVRLKQSLDMVFDYQMKHDRVYEWAYPDSLNSDINEDHPLDEDMSLVAEPLEKTDQETEKAQKNIAQKAKKSQEKLSNVNIEQPQFYVKENRFHASFVLKNMNSPKLAEGRLWAVAKVRDDQGKYQNFYYPEAIKKLEEGVPAQLKKSPPFSIRRYKKEECDFQVKKGFIEDISIGILLENNETQSIVIPVQKNIKDLSTQTGGNVAVSKKSKKAE